MCFFFCRRRATILTTTIFYFECYFFWGFLNIKETPVVPLFGDMHMQLLSFIKTGPHYDKTRWPQANEALSSEYVESYFDIVSKLPQFAVEKDELACQLALLSTKVSPSM